MPQLGPVELVVILVIVLVIFGAGRLADIGGAFGKGIREFKTAVRDDEPQPAPPPTTGTTVPPAAAPTTPPPAAAPTAPPSASTAPPPSASTAPPPSTSAAPPPASGPSIPSSSDPDVVAASEVEPGGTRQAGSETNRPTV